MKKYLMMGMAAVAFASVLSSCSSEDSVEQKSPIEINKLNYELAFVNKFGTPDKNHTWGFGTKVKTRGIATRGSENAEVIKKDQWENFPSLLKGYAVPDDVTQDEADYVYNWFKSNPNLTETGKNWSDFFIQQVYGTMDVKKDGVWERYDQNRNPSTWNENFEDKGGMDYLTVGDGTNMTHVNDFNAEMGGPWGIVLMVNSSALKFGYHGSWDNSDRELFKLAEIEVPGECFSDGVARKGWYVGLSLYGEKWDNGTKKLGQQRLKWGDDWILKVVPAEAAPVEYEDRIMCEDLGSVGDFDFNDVVFDVRYENGNAYVKLINIGGKLPLYVAGQEVHELMGAQAGADGNYPILGNVRNKSTEFEVAGVTSAADISIKVDGSILVKGENVTQSEAGAQLIELQAIKGQVPQKICVAPTVEPSAERVPISETYVKFPEWVQNENAEWN